MLGDIFWALVVAAAAVAGLVFALRSPERMREAPRGDATLQLELEQCERCGRKVADLGYHRRRCKGRPKRFRHSEHVKPFRPHERRDKT